jgi:hypothetical protein
LLAFTVTPAPATSLTLPSWGTTLPPAIVPVKPAIPEVSNLPLALSSITSGLVIAPLNSCIPSTSATSSGVRELLDWIEHTKASNSIKVAAIVAPPELYL